MRHILLPDVGGLGQTALLVACARIDLSDGGPAELIAASYLVAGGVGTVVARNASEPELATLAGFCPDTRLVTRTPEGVTCSTVSLPPPPPWWPAATGDATALAFWRGALAATRWMADVANASR